MGIERETSPFIFTKEFLRVMGGYFHFIFSFFSPKLSSFFHKDEGFKVFVDLSVKAYLLLRKKVSLPFLNSLPPSNNILLGFVLILSQTSLIISLFCIMLGSNAPGVSKYEDLYYLRDSLATNKTEEEAEEYFKELITVCFRC